MPTPRFQDKVAIITGAGSGIGRACAERLAREGARVVLADIQLDRAREAARKIEADSHTEALALACDVSREDQVTRCVAATLERFKSLHVIVNNAGLMTFKPLADLTLDDWNRVLAVDLLGAFLFLREGFRHMTAGGCVINVASVHAVETTPLVAPYAAAKAALVSLTRSAALEGKPRGIRVNAVLPGAIDTGMLWNNPNVKSGVEQVDQSMVGEPEDVAAAVAFLAADEAKFVRGATLAVDGGRLDIL